MMASHTLPIPHWVYILSMTSYVNGTGTYDHALWYPGAAKGVLAPLQEQYRLIRQLRFVRGHDQDDRDCAGSAVGSDVTSSSTIPGQPLSQFSNPKLSKSVYLLLGHEPDMCDRALSEPPYTSIQETLDPSRFARIIASHESVPYRVQRHAQKSSRAARCRGSQLGSSDGPSSGLPTVTNPSSSSSMFLRN